MWSKSGLLFWTETTVLDCIDPTTINLILQKDIYLHFSYHCLWPRTYILFRASWFLHPFFGVGKMQVSKQSSSSLTAQPPTPGPHAETDHSFHEYWRLERPGHHHQGKPPLARACTLKVAELYDGALYYWHVATSILHKIKSFRLHRRKTPTPRCTPLHLGEVERAFLPCAHRTALLPEPPAGHAQHSTSVQQDYVVDFISTTCSWLV